MTEVQSITSRGIAGYVYGAIAGAVSAFTFAFALNHAGSVLFLGFYLAAVPLFLAGLGAGVVSSLIASLVATACLFAGSTYGVYYAIETALPVSLLCVIAMRPVSANRSGVEGGLLAMLAIYPCLCFIAIYAATMHRDGGLLAMSLEAFSGMEAEVSKMLVANKQTVTSEIAASIHQYIAFAARIAPAAAMSAWMLSTMMTLGISQIMLQKQKWNLRPAFSLARLQVPTWIIFAAALTGLGAAFAPAPYDYVGLNLAITLGVPFFFVGLAVVHAYAAITRAPTLILVLFYIVVSVIVHLVLLVALIGALDQWVDFRKRFAERNLTKGEK